MSIKSIVLFTGLFMILSSQSNLIRADINEDIEGAESMRSSMRPLFDLDQSRIPLSEVEAVTPMPKLLMKDYTLMTQEALDKEWVPGSKGTSVLLTGLKNDIVDYQFAKRIQFSPNDVKKAESWLQAVEEKLQKWAANFPSAFYGDYGYGMLD